MKGGDNETDAGYQGLMRQAADGDPDSLISLYADAGCIGTIRGRAALGIEIPALTTSICAETAVIDEVGDDAIGWTFAGIQTDEDTPERAILQDILSPALGVPPEEVDPNALGLGALGLNMAMSLAEYSNRLVADGGEVTGTSLYDSFATSPGSGSGPTGRHRMRPSADVPVGLRVHVPLRRVPGGGRRRDRSGPRSGLGIRLPAVTPIRDRRAGLSGPGAARPGAETIGPRR